MQQIHYYTYSTATQHKFIILHAVMFYSPFCYQSYLTQAIILPHTYIHTDTHGAKNADKAQHRCIALIEHTHTVPGRLHPCSPCFSISYTFHLPATAKCKKEKDGLPHCKPHLRMKALTIPLANTQRSPFIYITSVPVRCSQCISLSAKFCRLHF